MNTRNIVISFLILFVFWILLNNTFEPLILLIGAGLSLIISLIFCRSCNVFSDIKLTPKSIFYSFVYVVVFLIEMIKSNLDVARRVLSPQLPINPGIIEVKTKLTSQMGRMILANSITLTPGTLTVDIKDDRIFIHWIDVKSEDIEEASNRIIRRFEKYLEHIYE